MRATQERWWIGGILPPNLIAARGWSGFGGAGCGVRVLEEAIEFRWVEWAEIYFLGA